MDSSIKSAVSSDGNVKLKFFATGGTYEVAIIFQVTKPGKLENLPDDPKKKEEEIKKKLE